jgi:hypothetical protein
MEDLTVIMLTANRLRPSWVAYHKHTLLREIGDAHFITVSYQPLDWGVNLIQTNYDTFNIYRQMLRAARIAKTPYVAIADDDTLYPREHFLFRPPPDKFAYNLNRWHVLAWKTKEPFYYLKHRPGNGCLISPRKLMITALENRFGREDYLDEQTLHELGSSHYLVTKFDKAEYVSFYTYPPIVSFYHDQSYSHLHQLHRTKPGDIQCFDLPKWGKARDIIKKFNGVK